MRKEKEDNLKKNKCIHSPILGYSVIIGTLDNKETLDDHVDALGGACTSAWGAAGAGTDGAGAVSVGAGRAWGRHLARTLPAAGRDSSSGRFFVSN
jgi:hypothetical protein